VIGSLFAGDKPRIVEVEEIPLEAEVAPHMLFVRNEDKPGLIGALGTMLGNAGINIASFHLGRKTPGEDALALVAMDQPAPQDLLNEVRKLPSVVRVRSLAF
jgi:D-3-phosphoglycerate dehydrogenase